MKIACSIGSGGKKNLRKEKKENLYGAGRGKLASTNIQSQRKDEERQLITQP